MAGRKRTRVSIGKAGLDPHDRGAKILAVCLKDAGMEIIYTGLHQTPESMRDMESLLEDLPLDRLHVSANINAPASILLAMYIVCADNRGIPPEKLSGVFSNSSLRGYICDGTHVFPPRPTLKLMIDVVKFCTANMPKWMPVTMAAHPLREAGTTAVQEGAFIISMALEIIRAGIEEGLDPDDFVPNLSWFFAIHNNFFEDIAKLRALRRVWAGMMKEKFGSKDPRTWRLKFSIKACGSTLVAQEPLNNIARVAIQALAGVLAGSQSIYATPYDEALDIPTEESVRIALRTQQIIEHETGIPDVADPFGGELFFGITHKSD